MLGYCFLFEYIFNVKSIRYIFGFFDYYEPTTFFNSNIRFLNKTKTKRL